MSLKSGQAITVLFATADAATGAAADATGTPTGTLYVNGTADAATVTVTNIATGRYKAAVTLPSLSAGDVVGLSIAATVDGVAGAGIVWQDVADTKRVSDLNDLSTAQVNAEVDTALADYDPPTKAEMDAIPATVLAALKAATYDGLTWEVIQEKLVAALLGDTGGNDTAVKEFYEQDGTTLAFTATIDENGNRVIDLTP